MLHSHEYSVTCVNLYAVCIFGEGVTNHKVSIIIRIYQAMQGVWDLHRINYDESRSKGIFLFNLQESGFV